MVGIIAGTGTLPVAACQALRAQNKSFCVISLFPQDNSAALRHAAGNAIVIEQAFYHASDILSSLRDLEVTHVLMIGKVDKQLLINNIKLDWLAVKLLASLTYKNDQQILQRIVDEFAAYNMTVLRQYDFLPMLMTKPGIITGTLDEKSQCTVQFGMHIAQKTSKLDLGQTIVVKDNMILAIEAIEGTDACIRRGINLGGGNVIICKAAQAEHNPQFDLPTLGSATLNNVQPGEIQIIAWLATHTLIADYDQFIARAQALNITLLAV
jgi:DUF1009 family protein